MIEGVNIIFTDDQEPDITDLNELRLDLQRLTKKYPFIKDWELKRKTR